VRDDVRVDGTPEEFVDSPPGGRRVTRTRAVRLADVTASGRIRLDALARYLQDVAADDGDEIGLGGAGAWVLRRAALSFDELPRFRDTLELTTFCSGVGPRWAERRTTIRIAGRTPPDSAVESAAVWVYVDGAGRPTTLEPWFHEHYGASANGRRVSGRLRLPAPPSGANARAWPLRSSDFDVLGHVNNAAAWTAVEDGLARLVPRGGGPERRLAGATIEYRAAIDPGDTPELVSSSAPGLLSCWLRCAGDVRTAALVRFDARDPAVGR
jgi:acyl-ACP thioesterase